MELIPQQIGSYLVREEIQSGPTATLFRAWDTLYDRPVALKVLSPYQVSDAESARRFVSDARTAMGLRHPNIVEIYDAGQAEGYHYIALELADKGTLADLLATQHQPLDKRDTSEAIKLIEQVAAALDYAHSIGTVHGALIPANLLLKSERLILLANFGQAGEQPTQLTEPDALTATLAYLSPEQARGNAQIDRQSDIFSLGIIVYRLLTGALPFQADNALALLRTIIEEEPTPADQLNSTLTPESGQVLARALAKEGADRHANAGEFVRELREAQNPVIKVTPILEEAPAQLVPAPNLLWTIYTKAKETVSGSALATTAASEPADVQAAASGERGRINLRTVAAATLCGLLVALLAFAGLLRATGTNLGLIDGLQQLAGSVEPSVQEPAPTRPDNATVQSVDAVEASLPNADNAADANFIPIALSRFEDPRNRYQLSVPADVQLVAHTNGVRFESPTLPMQLTVFHIADVVETAPLAALIDTYVQEKLSPTTSEIGNLQLLAEGERVVGGRVGYERTYRATFIGNPILMRLIAFKEGTQGYLLSTSIDAAHAPELESLVRAIVESFQLRQAQEVVQVAEAIQLPTVGATVAPTIAPPSPTPIPPTPIPPTPVPPTPAPSGPKIVAVGDFALEAATTDAKSEVAFVEEALPQEPVEVAPPAGHIAYAIWNPATDRMDTYIYNIATDVSWPRLVNRRQPDFRYNGELVLNSDGGGVENLVRSLVTGENETIVSEHPEDSRPHWAPSGKLLVFDSTFMGDREHRIYVQDDLRIRKELEPLRYDAWELFGRYPIFLADHRIAYSGCNVWENAGSCGIYVTDAGGTLPSQATQQPHDLPTDNLGSRILFMAARTQVNKVDNWDIYVVNADGSSLQRLTSDPARDGLATASPDGQYIAFVTDREGPWSVYVMRADGSQQRKLFDLGGEYGRGEQYWNQDWKQERISWGR